MCVHSMSQLNHPEINTYAHLPQTTTKTTLFTNPRGFVETLAILSVLEARGTNIRCGSLRGLTINCQPEFQNNILPSSSRMKRHQCRGAIKLTVRPFLLPEFLQVVSSFQHDTVANLQNKQLPNHRGRNHLLHNL